MKQNKTFLFLLAFVLIISLTFTNWESVKAQGKTHTITKDLVAGKSLYVPFGRGGVIFNKPAYSGTVILTRTMPSNTKKLTFTQPWLDIKLYDTKDKPITTVKGYTYVFFNLNESERNAWDNGNLKIYQYNVDRKIWQECKTYLIAGYGDSYGRVIFLVSSTYGTYGLAMKK